MEEFRDNFAVAEEEDYEQLRAKYLGKGRGVRGMRSKAELVCDLIVLFATLLISVTACAFFAMPRTTLGGVTTDGNTIDIFSFIYFSDSSMVNKIIDAVNSLTGSMEEIQLAGLVRYMVMLISATIVLIKSFIYAVAACVRFAKGNSAALVKGCARSLTLNLMAYVFFTFIGSVSGGRGSYAYYTGYVCGTGMTVGSILGLLALVTVAVIRIVKNKLYKKGDGKLSGLAVLVTSFVGHTVLCFMVTGLTLYSTFSYLYMSLLSIIVSAFTYGFSISTLVFPLANLAIFYGGLQIYQRAAKGASEAICKLASPSAELAYISSAAKNGSDKPVGFVLCIVASSILIAAVLIMQVPQFGYGAAPDILKLSVCMLVISIIFQVFYSIFKHIYLDSILLKSIQQTINI